MRYGPASVPPSFTRQLLEALPRLQSRARHLAGDEWAAEDLLHDTVVKALSRWHQYRAGTNFRAWLLVIMHNHHIDHVRAQRLRPLAVLALPEMDELATCAGAHAEAAEGEVPAWQCFGLADVEAATARLRPRYREAVRLVLLQGYSYRQAAAQLRSNDSTVGTRVGRARAQLRRLLGDRCGAMSRAALRAPPCPTG